MNRLTLRDARWAIKTFDEPALDQSVGTVAIQSPLIERRRQELIAEGHSERWVDVFLSAQIDGEFRRVRDEFPWMPGGQALMVAMARLGGYYGYNAG